MTDKNCFECNQECCKSVIVEIDKPETHEDWEDVKWQVAHHNVRVLLDNEDDWCIEFLTECDMMDENGKCKIYNRRPIMCRNHHPDTCIINGEGDYHQILFTCIKDVEDYLEKHPEAIKEEEEDEPTICPKCGYTWVEENEEESDEEDSEDETEEAE
jgi:hypothetical protein